VPGGRNATEAGGAHGVGAPAAATPRRSPRVLRTWRARPHLAPVAAGQGPAGARGALWRSLAVFRWASLCYATAAAVARLDDAYRPGLGIGLLGLMIAWSAALTLLVPRADRGDRPRLLGGLILADVVVCAGMVVGAELVGPRSSHALPMMWATSGVFGAALLWGAAGGIASGLLVAAMFIAEWHALTDALVGTTVLLLVSGAVAGHLSRTALRAEAALADTLEAWASDAERERLARRVHDGVLQVLALIAREAPRGMPADEVARIAAEQEGALRDLLRAPAAHGPAPAVGDVEPDAQAALGARAGWVSAVAARATDLAQALLALAHSTPRLSVTVATPGVPVLLPADRAVEVVAAVRAALDNVARHAGADASAWVLLEDDGDEIVVTIRDDGVGMAAGRAEQAAAEGRLGLAMSVHGRVRDLGGEVAVLSRPGQGTEVELRVPR